MKLLVPMLKRCASYGLLLFPIACLQQEIRPDLDKSTRGCLIRQTDEYAVSGTEDITKNTRATWQLTTRLYEYNLDGNPSRIKFTFGETKRRQLLTMDYKGLRLVRINKYAGAKENPDSLIAYKTLDISPDFLVIVEHTFERQSNKSYKETLTLVNDFFRNTTGALKLKKTEHVTPQAKPDNVGKRLGTYWISVYDDNDENVIRRLYKKSPDSPEVTSFTFGGYDLNGHNTNDANFWLSYTANFGIGFGEGDGVWNENNVALLGYGNGPAFAFFSYELNEEGFPCFSSTKRANNEPDLGKTFYYYYNCNCR